MFNNEDIIKAKPLYFSERNGKNLVVSIELGTWLILDDNIIKLLKEVNEEKTYKKIEYLSYGNKKLFDRELLRLYQLGFISINNQDNLPKCSITKSIIEANKVPNLCMLHVSNNCNLECRYCYAHTDCTDKKNMDIKVMKKAIDRFFELDINNINIEFHGGEPLVQYKNIMKACSYAIELANKQHKKVSFSMQSNMTFLNEDCIKMLKKYNISIRISLDGMKEDNDYYRIDKNGKGSYNKIINNLKILNENGIYPEVVSVVSKRNVDKLIDMYKLFVSLNLSRIRLVPFWSQGMGNEISSDVVPPEYLVDKYIELMEWMLEYNKQQSDNNKKIKMFSLQKEIEALTSFSRSYMCLRCPCGAGINMVDVSVDGNIYPCEEMNEIEEMCIGNIYSGTIMDQYKKSNVIKALKERNPDNIEECVSCPWKRHCQSGCANKNYQRYGAIETKSDKCDFYKKYFEELIWFMHRKGEQYKEII